MLSADVVIDAPDPVLGEAPKAFDGVRVRVAVNVDASGVVNALMFIAKTREISIDACLIGEDGAARHDALSDVRQNCARRYIGNDSRDHATLPLNSAPNCRLADRPSIAGTSAIPMLVAFFPAEITLVGFDFARQFRTSILIEHRANPVEHSPRAFVGDSNLAFQLLCADSASRRRHEIDRVEPKFQGRGRILEDRPFHRMLMVAAILARIRWALGVAMMLGDRLAGGAENSIRIESLHQHFETRCIIRVLSLELHERVQPFRCARTDRLVSINLAHTANHGIFAYCRQGDTYPSFRQKLFQPEASVTRFLASPATTGHFGG